MQVITTPDEFILFLFIILSILFFITLFTIWTLRHEISEIRRWKKEQSKSEESLSFKDFDWKDFKINN